MIWSRVLISHRHNVSFVAHNFHDRLKIGPVHPQAGSEGVPQAVKAKADIFLVMIVSNRPV